MKPLTVGEIAKLFNISKYSIRHYIDKGILTPKRNEENQYYTFEESDIYRLYQIKTLREIGFSIKEIQESLELDNVKSMFEEAETKIQREINKLLATQKTINKIVNSQRIYKLNEVVFVEQEERYFKKLIKHIIEGDSINYAKAVDHEILHLDEPYFILSKNMSEVMCLKSTKECNDYVFPAGTYACKNFVVENITDIEKQVSSFFNDSIINLRDYLVESYLLYENIYCSLAYNDKMVYSIEVKL
ncbi:MerR family transcriptional regulator [Enterococcus faecalis]|uniref:MerR family transcriptional regulator n=1 Tax=Enterococcus TaxID=1350 RepID=UPI00156DE234|nr:MerR family transcriptional regulator [Enterococcus faecalis]EGO2712214.1 MerR family transcriptional regulator [Enterococcus faecalis]EGO7802004.1 MerR family transcriptional regulator [Enterococcus faecalis]EGO8493111.1 MerR family transcriptional regulator [Enterococcus faecalis]EGO8667148.1 MerR family transcriptional regulator [Enterococcus faecalis]MBJ1687134.1 MerR family transcriptional regulator [Enterococcus faecalis]